MQNRLQFGRNCRLPAAETAGTTAAKPRAPEPARPKRTNTLFAQFPPVALFKAIGRAGMRSVPRQRAASGTAVAWGRLVLASEEG